MAGSRRPGSGGPCWTRAEALRPDACGPCTGDPRRSEARPLVNLSDFQPAVLSDFGPAVTAGDAGAWNGCAGTVQRAPVAADACTGRPTTRWSCRCRDPTVTGQSRPLHRRGGQAAAAPRLERAPDRPTEQGQLLSTTTKAWPLFEAAQQDRRAGSRDIASLYRLYMVLSMGTAAPAGPELLRSTASPGTVGRSGCRCRGRSRRASASGIVDRSPPLSSYPEAAV